MIDDLSDDANAHVHAHLKSFVDTKLLLGYWYNEWTLRSPTMEDANAIQGEAANEFGQANHFMTVLEALGTDVDAYVARDDPAEYYNLEVLDEAPDSWAAFLATVGFADVATQVRLESFEESSLSSLAEPAGKAIQEEAFHTQYLVGAVKSYVIDNDDLTADFRETLAETVPAVLHWFGPETDVTRELVDADVFTRSPAEERTRYLSRVTSFVDDHFEESFTPGGRAPSELLATLEWDDWNADRVRTNGGGPDPEVADVLSIEGVDAAIGLD